MKQNNLNQSGRSMVEILGTLAIIGVLSVAAIVGYSYAMDKYRANRTMHDVNIRAMDVMAQFDATGDASLDNWKNEKTIYPISLEEGTIGIQVDKVPERVCEMMAEGMEHSSSAIKINAEYVEEDAGDCGDDNTLVFYFDGNPIGGEGNNNEPVREQCGDILCEQCFTCNQDTMTCVSVMDELYETADNVDDFRICANNGYKSYCGLVGEGCAEIGTCGGDPECNVRVDGACQPLDSTIYLQMGVGGFRCTKNGKEGYCFNGQCSEGIPDAIVACAEKESEETCEVNGQVGMCLAGQCLATCSGYGDKCDAFGKKGVCVSFVCIPLTDDGCHASLFGQTEQLPDELAFACEKDGIEGVCIGGACTSPCTGDHDCADEAAPYCVNGVCRVCTENAHCGDTVSDYCSNNSCGTCPADKPYWNNDVKKCVACIDNSCEQCFTCDQSTNTCVSVMEKMDNLSTLDDLRICSSNGYQSYCGISEIYGSEDMGCAKLGVCSGDPECNALIDGECQPLDSTMFLQNNLGGFKCTKDGKDGYCMSGTCVNIDSTCVENGGGATCIINGENGYCMYDGSCAPIEAACSEKENGAECTKNEQVGACLFGQCIAKCSSEKSKCDAFGQDGICSLSLCFPLLNECYYDLLGAKNTIPENLSFACGNNGYCSNGSCISRCTADSDCTDATKPFCRDDGACIACTQDSHCGDTVSDYCQNNVCKQCSYPEPAWDAKQQECVECLDNSHCAYEYTYDDKPYCVNRTCVECTSHDHCDAVQYCGDANTSGTEAHLGGSCHDLDYTDYTITYTDTSGASKTGTFYIASDSMSWWDANSFCNTLGRKLGKSLSLPAVSELSVEIQNGGLIDTEHHPSDLAKQLLNKAGIYTAWTSDISSVDTSKATYVELDMAIFGTNIRTQDRTLKRIAVCR